MQHTLERIAIECDPFEMSRRSVPPTVVGGSYARQRPARYRPDFVQIGVGSWTMNVPLVEQLYGQGVAVWEFYDPDAALSAQPSRNLHQLMDDSL